MQELCPSCGRPIEPDHECQGSVPTNALPIELLVKPSKPPSQAADQRVIVSGRPPKLETAQRRSFPFGYLIVLVVLVAIAIYVLRGRN